MTVTPGRAVVIGAGLAGIATAAALSGAGWRVAVLERDSADTGAGRRRRGLPQSEQLHNLLGRGQRALDALLPGFTSALLGAGAGLALVARDTHVYELGARMPERDLDLAVVCAPRTTIDRVALHLLRHCHEQVDVQFDTRVVGLLVDGPRVAGVEVEGGRIKLADLVVDASGAASNLQTWLQQVGLAAPTVLERPVRQWYSTAIYERSGEMVGVDRAWMIFPTEDQDKGALVSPLGRKWWCVSASGRHGSPPPSTHEGLLEHTAALADPAVSELLRRSTPIDPPTTFRKPVATWRRFDRVDSPLVGLLVLGDAVASLNPLHGQAMSVAAWQAQTSAELLGATGDLEELTREYHRRAAACVDAAWRLADLAEAPTQSFLEALAPGVASVDEFVARLTADAALHRWYVSLWHLLEPLPASAAQFADSVGGSA